MKTARRRWGVGPIASFPSPGQGSGTLGSNPGCEGTREETTVELIRFYECSQVPFGHPTGLQWRPAALLRAGLITRARATTAADAVDAVLQPYEVHHLPHPVAAGR